MEQVANKIDEYVTLIMERFDLVMQRFDQIESKLERLYETNSIKDSDLLVDEDVQLLLNISKRTLQRYKQQNLLPYSKIKGKSYYLGFDVILFKRSRVNK